MTQEVQGAHDLGEVRAQTELIKLNGRTLVGYRAGSKLPAKSRKRRDGAYLKLAYASRRIETLQAEYAACQDEVRRDQIDDEAETLLESITEAEVEMVHAMVPGLSRSEAELVAGDAELLDRVRALLGYNDRKDEPEAPKEEPQKRTRSRRKPSTTDTTSPDSPDSQAAE